MLEQSGRSRGVIGGLGAPKEKEKKKKKKREKKEKKEKKGEGKYMNNYNIRDNNQRGVSWGRGLGHRPSPRK